MANNTALTTQDSGILARFLNDLAASHPRRDRATSTTQPAHQRRPNKSPALRARRHATLASLPSAAAAAAMVSAEVGIDYVLWTEAEVSARVGEVAAELAADLRAQPEPAVVVGVATGAFLFLADLVRRVDVRLAVDFVRVESYGAGTESSGKPRITSDLKVDVAGKHVVVVEDIVDTGNTLSCLIAHLEKKGASSISVCTFLDKPARRKVSVQLVGDGKFYRGFECPDYFVVGYGLDYAELYRNLPYVGVLKPEMYKKDSSN
ncbi:hypothetical protein BDA96_09G071800 [Sorghum bicolor]|uniref:Hypoxanthine phosphoribosyltransferase n=2 Tax=Sorghum bicolor TaxID=4558 RepID=A0A1Z5R1E9_SORBI|nr:uncharacterized protein LOC8064204 [Sorghum bicolor]KAG0517240.1 hypothetical protein BDA96_09G071800 [Sorghum bicolor]OQU77560.1 hypothetical protein SORBI_3009G068200 [Sorghum bicolor]|eukprot:XP_002439390.2 uncharacterized protein LOC8064204 [Sorghum bicolor]